MRVTLEAIKEAADAERRERFHREMDRVLVLIGLMSPYVFADRWLSTGGAS